MKALLKGSGNQNIYSSLYNSCECCHNLLHNAPTISNFSYCVPWNDMTWLSGKCILRATDCGRKCKTNSRPCPSVITSRPKYTYSTQNTTLTDKGAVVYLAYTVLSLRLMQIYKAKRKKNSKQQQVGGTRFQDTIDKIIKFYNIKTTWAQEY